MRYAYETGVDGEIDHIIDNEAVVRVFQDCEVRGPTLVSSQDVWDEIIWYKGRLGSRYRVRWSRGHAERRGGIRSLDDKLNHLADGLADAGYDRVGDLRHFFRHARRWHVRLGGVRPFGDVRRCARLHVGTRRLRRYREGGDDSRPFDLGALRAQCGGAMSRDCSS